MHYLKKKRTKFPSIHGGKGKKRIYRGGVSLPPIMQAQDRTMKMRRQIDKSSNLPLFIVQGTKAVFNQRVKEHSMDLLEPGFTRHTILEPFKSKFANNSSSSNAKDKSNVLATVFESKVDAYVNVHHKTLENQDSVLQIMKTLREFIDVNITETQVNNTCNSLPQLQTVEEDIYVLSIFAQYQGQQLRNAFRMTPVLKPADDELYCSVSKKMEIYEPRLTKIVASIVSNFNGNDDVLVGGSKRKLRTNDKKQIRSYLQTKTTKQLYTYTQLRNIRVSSKMSKQDLIETIINTFNKR